MKTSLGVLVIFFLVATGSGVGQEQTASIEGTVRDPSGAVVPGAHVEANAPSGVGVATVTGSTGRYRFPSLPVGRYAVAAVTAGFAPARVDDVRLLLGQILEVDLVLAPAGVSESIVVAGEPPRLDVKQSARSTSIRDERITLLPRGRDFSSLITQATAAKNEGHAEWRGISIDGSSGSENRFVVDGIETTHLIDGNTALGVITDAVEEMQVRSSGYAAEHGGATGGVINLVTRSGSNRWSGQAGVYYTSDWLQGKARPFPRFQPDGTVRHVTAEKDSVDRVEPSVHLSGPLKKDVAWFFLSASPAFTSRTRNVILRGSSETQRFENHFRTYGVTTNVSAQLGDRTRARVAFNMSPTIDDGVLPPLAGGAPTADYDVVTHVPSRAFSGNVDYVAAPNLFLSARAGYWFMNTHHDGVYQGARYSFARSNVGMAGVPPELQGPRFTSNVFSNNEVTRNEFTRATAQVDGTLYVTAAGRHALKAGVQHDRLGNDVLGGSTGNVVFLVWGEPYVVDGVDRSGPFGHYIVSSNGVIPERGGLTEGDVHSYQTGLFIQDAWTIAHRLTLNVGVRAESETVPSYTSAYGNGPTAFEFGFGEKFAPRIGAAWDVKGDGKWKAYGSWGVFYDAMKYLLARDRFGGNKALEYAYSLETPDWPSLMRPGCPPACPGTLLYGPIDLVKPFHDAVDPDIEPFRMHEAVAGVEHALTRLVSVGARYVHKEVDMALEDLGWRDPAGNQVYIIGNPGFGRGAQTPYGVPFPKAVREYDALELTFDRRMASRWALHTSYVLSRLFGNYGGHSAGDEGTPTPNRGFTFNDPFSMFGADGKPLLGVMDADRTHQLKAHAIYELPFGTSVGTSARVMSGTPVTRVANFGGYSIAYQGRGSDGRLPTMSQLDVYAQHEVKLSGDRRLQLAVNVLNLFDQDAPLIRYQNQLDGRVAISPEEFFQGFDGAALIEAQNPPRDALFLKDYHFQPPREIRLSVKVMF